jgi:hypothetical protein
MAGLNQMGASGQQRSVAGWEAEQVAVTCCAEYGNKREQLIPSGSPIDFVPKTGTFS